eukprot:995066-Pyramimonas_sp.AAC.1
MLGNASQCTAMCITSTQHNAMQCGVISSYAKQFDVTQCAVTQSSAIQHTATPSNAKPCNDMRIDATQCDVMDSITKECRARASHNHYRDQGWRRWVATG